ncbi:MAG: hypothetical protein HY074_20140 [Deltaproteobacteria bacterium]|nr:hypothetical protein [Deltaproteobacteria bacterium]
MWGNIRFTPGALMLAIAAMALAYPASAERSRLRKKNADGTPPFTANYTPLDHALQSTTTDSFELVDGIDDADRQIELDKTRIENIRIEKDTPVQLPRPWDLREKPAEYPRMLDKRCNRKSVSDDEHLSPLPTNDLCLRIFNSSCYERLTQHEKDTLGRCPAVYLIVNTKEYRSSMWEKHLADLREKRKYVMEKLGKVLNKQVEKDQRNAKYVPTPWGDVFVAPKKQDEGKTPIKD